MLVTDFILWRLADEGIDTAFYLYGGAIAPLMDAVSRQTRIRAIGVHHEQAAGFAAEGYSKASGRPGLAIVTSGPGGQNVITAIANAYYDSTPVIFVCGQVSTQFMRKTPALRQLGFQETPIVEIAQPLVKRAYQLHEAKMTSRVMNHLIAECTMGRPGPVLLDLPINLQRMEAQ